MTATETTDWRLRSSPFTFFAKFVLPTIFVLGFAVAAVTHAFHHDNGVAVFFSLAALASAFVAFPSARRLKRVYFTPTGVVVSDYFSEAEIPWSGIAAISEYRWSRTPLYVLRFRCSTRFGRVIHVLLPSMITPELLASLRSEIHNHANANVA